MKEVEVALEVLECGADGVQTPRIHHGRCRRKVGATSGPPSLDNHVPVGGAAVAARHRRRGRGWCGSIAVSFSCVHAIYSFNSERINKC
jgi:hypothetical protein